MVYSIDGITLLQKIMRIFFNDYFAFIYSSMFQWLVPNGGWIQTFNEIIMNICDFLFGHGNWLWAEYGQWILLEGIVSPYQIYGQSRNLNNIQTVGNNSYYQGKYHDVLFKKSTHNVSNIKTL